MSIVERNAVIKSTTLGIEDHGCFAFFLDLDYGGAGQGFGGYGLDEPYSDPNAPDLKPWEERSGGRFIGRRGTAYGADAILRVLKTLGVDSWEKLPGTPCRARQEHTRVDAIGHYLKDQWLDLAELAKEWGISDEDQSPMDTKATK